ncbi:MAG TPA: DEAD/DEAH box helicase [Polyangia bacterium]|jgi:ATP-dependent RNA helicase DeaD|nr:DEAD/DEAH box helicase [Polyangia bacterium]
MKSPTPTFSEMSLPAPLAEAIAARGYETPTGVQAAVADAAHAGRDLLVSSATGSGKTLAFGLALAESLLADAPPAEPGKRAAGPRALVITPTRELATQVRTELGWLYAKTKLRIAVFTGGTDVRGDLAQLRPGVDLVVGTPGRLVDLVTRKSLRLDAVHTVVLDEADEMLDMGFREDLETLLAARAATTDAPREASRTLMFSATLPDAILSMAARYQKNAVRVDARTHTGAGAGGHQDINYVAHLVAMGERIPAVINVLRQHAGVRAIVFGTTRDGVADLHQELVNRGFRAVALSGDRAQSERTRALTALRNGEVDILVATNVAARGLDLPEVDLVLHADLPLNAEALTHRSGRTGRAGRKGTSVLIATVAERRKAERLFSNARLTYTWTAAPGANELARAAQDALATSLLEASRDTGATAAGDARELAARLTTEADRDALLVALLSRELARMPTGERLTDVDLRGRSAPPLKGGPRPTNRDFSRGAVRFEVNLGQNQKAEPGWLLPLICRRGGVTRNEVGAIRVGPQSSQFEILGEAADEYALAAGQTDPRAPHVRIQRIDHGSQGSQNFGAPPARSRERGDGPPRYPSRSNSGPPRHAPRDRRDAPAPFKPTLPTMSTTSTTPAVVAPSPAPSVTPAPHKAAPVSHAPAPHKAHAEAPAPHKAHAEAPAPHKPRPHADAPAPHKPRPHTEAPAPHKPRPHADAPHKAAPPHKARAHADVPVSRKPRPHGDAPPPRNKPRAYGGDAPPVRSDGRGAWRPPAGRPQPGPHKAGNRRPPRPR